MSSPDTPSDAPQQKPRSRKTLIIVLLLIAGFVYFAVQAVTYDPHRVLSVRKEQGFDAVRFKLVNQQECGLIGVAISPAETRDVAREIVRQLIEGKHIDIETDQLEVSDKRLLGYVYIKVPGGQKALDERLEALSLPTGKVQLDSKGRVFINELLIRLGLSRTERRPPNLKRQNQLEAAQSNAQRESLGIWLNWTPESPSP